MKTDRQWKKRGRKRKLRVLAAMLCFCLLVTACPHIPGAVSARAAETHSSHPACGTNCSHGGTHNTITNWTPFTSTGGELSSGNYYLTGDVTITKRLEIKSGTTVNLCLNGHKIMNGIESGNGESICISGTLTICDCKGGGIVSGNNADGTKKSIAVYMSGNGTFNLYGGTITGGYTHVVSVNSSSVCNIYGGTITGGYAYAINNLGKVTVGGNAKVTTDASGGRAVYNNGSQPVLTVQDNACLISEKGSGIYAYGGTISIGGGTVTGDEYGVEMGSGAQNLTLNGNPEISGTTADLCLRTKSGATLNDVRVDASGYTGGTLMVTEYSLASSYDGAYAIKVSNENKDKFVLTNSGWCYWYKDGGLTLFKHTHSYTYKASGAVITESCSCGHKETATLSVKSDVNLTYSGSQIKPVTITYSDGWAGTGTKKPADTAITYTNNTNAGTATAKLTVSGAIASTTFTIASAEMSGVSARGYTGIYDGEFHSIEVTAPEGATVKYGINEGTYQTSENPSYDSVGSRTVYYQVTKPNYKTVTGSAKVIITACSISNAIVTLSGTSPIYNGSELTREVTKVTVNGRILTPGTDYKVSGTGVDVGSHTLTVTGNGNYSGTKQVNFKIEPKSLTDGMITVAPGPHYYTGNAIEPAVTVQDGSTTLKSGTDYTVSYENNTNIGTADVIVTGKGNYTGSIQKTFAIACRPLPDGKSLTDYVSISPLPNDDGWYNSDITLKPENGYRVGDTLDGTGTSFVIAGETGTDGDTKTIYIKDGDGNIYQTQFSSKRDKTPPVIDITDMSVENGSKNLWDWIIGKESMIIKIPAADITDALSGIAEVTYTAASDSGTEQTETISAQDGYYVIALNRAFSGTIRLTAKDKADNTIQTSLTAEGGKVIAEGNAPVVTFTFPDTMTPNEDGWYNTGFDLTVTVTDDKDHAVSAGIASVKYQVGSSNEVTVPQDFTTSMKTSTTFTIPADEIPAGGIEITVTAVDHAGNSVVKKQTVKIMTEEDKVEAAKQAVEDVLAGITATNEITKEEIQRAVDAALTKDGISDVTVTVGELDKTEATTSEAGSISGNITIQCGDVTDNVVINKSIEKLPKTDAEKVEAAGSVVEEALAGITVTNEITKEEIQRAVDAALAKAEITDVTVTVGELDKTEATTSEAGSISGNVTIQCGDVTDNVVINMSIEKLPKSDAEKVEAAGSVVEEALAGITATNGTTKEEIQRVIDDALTNAEITDVTVTVGDFSKTDATTSEAGSISGNITIQCGDVTDNVVINKRIEKLPKSDAEKVEAAGSVVEEALAGITVTNETTKEEIQRAVDDALTKAEVSDVTITVGDLSKTEATTSEAGSISGNVIIQCGDVTDHVVINKSIEKLPKSDTEKVEAAKKTVEEALAGIIAGNETTQDELQSAIDDALTKAGITDVTVTVGELDKTEATTSEAGSIRGNISVECGGVTDNVAFRKTIEKLPVHIHTWTWVITKAATVDEDGEMTGICTCGERTTAVIPKTGEGGSGTVIVKEDEENGCKASLADKEDVKGKVSLTDEEKEHLNTGENLVIILRLKDVDVAADTQEKTEIQNKLETNTLGTFLDIELLKQIGGTETKIVETTDKIEVTFEIPKHIRNTDDTVTRTYQIMRNHGGVVDILDVENYDEAANLLTFKTDKFSTYALVYRDTRKAQTAVTGVTLDKGDVTLIKAGETVQLTASVEPADATNRKVIWSSSDPKVATVDENGKITAVGSGTCTVTVTTEDGNKTVSCKVTVHIGATDNPSTEAPGITGTPSTEAPGTTNPPSTEAPGTTNPPSTETPGTTNPSSTETPGTTNSPSTETPGTTNPPSTAPGTTNLPSTEAPGTTGSSGQPESGTLPQTVLIKNALSLNVFLKVSQTGKKINVVWGKIAEADGYDIYVQYCGKKFTKKSITAIKNGRKTKVSVKKVNEKPINLKKNYKVYVVAYKMEDGKKVTLGKTITAHIIGRKNARYTNVKAVKVKKRSYDLRKGKIVKIKAKTVLVDKTKKQLSNAHAKQFRYATSNKAVATVSKKGKIKAVGAGSCTIYVYARNGYAKKIKVKVK